MMIRLVLVSFVVLLSVRAEAQPSSELVQSYHICTQRRGMTHYGPCPQVISKMNVVQINRLLARGPTPRASETERRWLQELSR